MLTGLYYDLEIGNTEILIKKVDEYMDYISDVNNNESFFALAKKDVIQ